MVFETEVMSLSVFALVQMWTIVLPYLDTGVVLVVSGTCCGGLSLTHVDVTAKLGQRSSSFFSTMRMS